MKECKCKACERIVCTGKPSDRFVCDICVDTLIKLYQVRPDLKP